MELATLIAGLNYTRERLLGTLAAIEKSGQDPAKVLAWRPGPGRAHIAWQAMHCAATHDSYCNKRIRNAPPKDEALLTGFGGGSTPSDTNVPTLAEIRLKLETTFADTMALLRPMSQADLDRQLEMPNKVQRSVGESFVFLTWHEAHHQGQIHLTWNLYNQAHRVQ